MGLKNIYSMNLAPFVVSNVLNSDSPAEVVKSSDNYRERTGQCRNLCEESGEWTEWVERCRGMWADVVVSYG
jgi:hypothetical protein